jgi:hypothetical protein
MQDLAATCSDPTDPILVDPWSKNLHLMGHVIIYMSKLKYSLNWIRFPYSVRGGGSDWEVLG